MPNTHKAWRLHAHNDLRFDVVETPTPAPDGDRVFLSPHLMYARQVPGQLSTLAAEGLLDLNKIIVTTFRLADFKLAVEAAALMQGLDLTAVVP